MSDRCEPEYCGECWLFEECKEQDAVDVDSIACFRLEEDPDDE